MMLCLISVALTLLRYDGAVSQLISMRTHDRQSSVITVRLMQNILDRTQSGDRLILGPTHALPEWLAYDRDVRPIPQVRQNWPSFTTWLVERNVRLVVLDREVWNRRRPLLGVYWTLTEAGLMADSLPPGWKLVAPKVYPCDPCLYTFDSAPYLPEVTANLVYENQAVLGGYNLTPAILSAERAFTLTLHWRLQQDMNENIHVFTHILGADGALVAQHDGPLVDLLGIAEHDQYQVGTRIHDVHPLPPLPSGTYSVRVGLYRWATQIRLTATSTDFSLSSNYPELLRLHICE